MNFQSKVIEEKNLVSYIINNFQENAIIEISYNRVFIYGKILSIDEEGIITIQLLGNLLNQRVDVNINEIKKELVEIRYTYDNNVSTLIITN